MTTSQVSTTTWQIDPAHTIAEFSVKHLMITTVKGRFKNLSGKVQIDEERPENSWVQAQIEVASVDTGIDMRDDDLRSDNFFNATDFPYITFKSIRVERVDNESWKVIGDLTIRDITKEVVLDTDFDGRIDDMAGKERVAFTAETSINRKDFGLKYNAVLETGTVVVGDRVKITLHVEAVREY